MVRNERYKGKNKIKWKKLKMKRKIERVWTNGTRDTKEERKVGEIKYVEALECMNERN